MSLEKKVEKVLTTVEKIEKKLFGNGDVGLFERVRNLEKLKKIPSSVKVGLEIVLVGLMIYFLVKPK